VTVENKLGLHARPAAELVKLASKFESEITISKDEMAVNGKSILGVMTLAAERGCILLVRAEGADARNKEIEAELSRLEARLKEVEQRFSDRESFDDSGQVVEAISEHRQLKESINRLTEEWERLSTEAARMSRDLLGDSG